jgi:hypothetical protein
MIRSVIIKGKEYYVVTTSIKVDGIEASVQIHINVSSLSEKDKYKIYKYANYFFNHNFTAIQKPKPKKPWYKFW